MSYIFAQLLFLFILLIVNYTIRAKKLCKLQLTSLQDIYPTLKTGDLIFSRFDYYYDHNILQYLFRNVLYSRFSDMYTHVGLIVRIDDKVYIYTSYEVVNYDWITGTYKTGSVLISLPDYVMTYGGNVTVFRLHEPMENTARLHQVMIQNKNKAFDKSNIRAINTIVDLTKNKLYPDKLICAQAVGDGLIGLGLMSPLTHTPNLSVGDITSFVNSSEKYRAPTMIVNSYVKTKCL